MRVLIVDDDPTSQELLRLILAPYGRCDLCFDGREAIDAFRTALVEGRPYDLVCMDILMPGMDGHEALVKIRQIERHKGVFGLDGAKVIMTTAVADPKQCIRAFREGCESYCTKPLSEEKVMARVHQLFGGLPSQRQSATSSPR